MRTLRINIFICVILLCCFYVVKSHSPTSGKSSKGAAAKSRRKSSSTISAVSDIDASSTSDILEFKDNAQQTFSSQQSNAWVRAFCNAKGREFYTEIPRSFIEDPVTTSAICYMVESPFLEVAIQLINGNFSVLSGLSEDKVQSINLAAEELYNLLHARYVTTFDGLKAVRAKYDKGVFGQCPRVYCRGHPLIAVGMHDRPKRSTVKCFCPKCRDIYHPQTVRHRSIDGAAFGTSLPHLFLQRFIDLAPTRPADSYIPRIFGFRLHYSAPELQLYYTDIDGDSDR